MLRIVRRFRYQPVLAPEFAVATGVGSSGAGTTRTGRSVSATGAITALGGGATTVAGARSLTSRLGPDSPGVGDYHAGDRVRGSFVSGALRAFSRA